MVLESQAFRHYIKVLKQSVERQHPYTQMTQKQIDIHNKKIKIAALARDGLGKTEIAVAVGVTRQWVDKVIREMNARESIRAIDFKNRHAMRLKRQREELENYELRKAEGLVREYNWQRINTMDV